jgi:hypothetical protein
MDLDLDRVLANARQASTEDLLDRVTVYRRGMEPEAVTLCEEELYRRGVTATQIADHAEANAGCLQDAEGVAMRCSFCRRPARIERWGWHRLWGMLPVFPRRLRYCDVHEPRPREPLQQ